MPNDRTPARKQRAVSPNNPGSNRDPDPRSVQRDADQTRDGTMSALPIVFATDTGTIEYTNAGQADADLASAGMALEGLLRRSDLSPAQRRDFAAALRWTRRAAQAIGRHVDYDTG